MDWLEVAALPQLAVPDEAALWHTYRQRVYRYLLRLTQQRETAEDLTQETFLRAIRDRRRSHRAIGEEEAWIFRIATNLARDFFRRRRLIAWVPFLADGDGGAASDPTDAVGEQTLVLEVLKTLPPETAAMLLLKDGEGFSTREVAAMMGRDYEAVRKRLARARLHFRNEYRRREGGAR
ncbi:MAG: RNA polymerase sigma factor [Bacillota bacterium]